MWPRPADRGKVAQLGVGLDSVETLSNQTLLSDPGSEKAIVFCRERDPDDPRQPTSHVSGSPSPFPLGKEGPNFSIFRRRLANTHRTRTSGQTLARSGSSGLPAPVAQFPCKPPGLGGFSPDNAWATGILTRMVIFTGFHRSARVFARDLTGTRWGLATSCGQNALHHLPPHR